MGDQNEDIHIRLSDHDHTCGGQIKDNENTESI